MDIEIQIPPEARALSEESKSMLMAAKGFLVQSQDEYEMAGVDLRAIKAKANELESTRKTMTRPMDEAKKIIMDFFAAPLSYLTEAESTLKRAMLTYQQDVERKRRQEEQRMQELARKEAEKLRKQAETAEAKGRTGKAEVLRAQAETVPVPIVATPKPEAHGISTRDNWSAEVTDKMALLRAILNGEAPVDLIDINMRVLNSQARALKTAMKYPGVRVTNTPTLAARI